MQYQLYWYQISQESQNLLLAQGESVLFMPFWYLHNTFSLLRILRMKISFYSMNIFMAFLFYAVIPPQRQPTRDIQSFIDCLVLGWHRALLEGSLVPNQTVAWGVKISKEIHNTLLPACKSTLSYHYSNMEPYILAIYSHHFPSATQNATRTSIQRDRKG